LLVLVVDFISPLLPVVLRLLPVLGSLRPVLSEILAGRTGAASIGKTASRSARRDTCSAGRRTSSKCSPASSSSRTL
jgi:hypothetical protein